MLRARPIAVTEIAHQIPVLPQRLAITGTSGTAQSAELARIAANTSSTETPRPSPVKIGDETFLATTVLLAPSVPPFVRLTVLKSYDKGAIFLTEPLDNHGWEWRSDMRDPDGYLIEVGQYTQLALDHFKKYAG